MKITKNIKIATYIAIITFLVITNALTMNNKMDVILFGIGILIGIFILGLRYTWTKYLTKK